MKRPLDLYAEKRKFARTPEPGPELAKGRAGPLLFVVQKHAARRLHYDFRLELDGVLKSWAVPKGPSFDVSERRLAVEVEDHPFDYASFEGVIPKKEYGAGTVIVWDCGVYSPDEGQQYSFGNRFEAEERVRTELAKGKLSFFLRGEKLKGSFALVRTSQDKQWLLIKHKDRFANGHDVLSKNRSVLSSLTLEDLEAGKAPSRTEAAYLAPVGAKESMPAKLAPMMAETSDSPVSDARFLYEPKLDGYRVIAYVENTVVRLVSRRGIDLTLFFPEVVSELATQAVDRMVLDGEIIALGEDGRPSFNALQNRAQLKTEKEVAAAQRDSPAVYMCFDLLHFEGLNLRVAPYLYRRRYLCQCLLTSAHIQLTHVAEHAEKLYAVAVESGYEGIMGKRKDSIYQPGKRTPAWLKIKAVQSAEFVVGGYTKGKGEREPLGALLLGYWTGKKLHYAGHVGSGLTESVVQKLREQFGELGRKSSPFSEKPPLHRPTTWLEPRLAVEVNFTDWTPDGLLRAPVFLRVRDDIEPQNVQRSTPTRRVKKSTIPTPACEIEAVLEQLDRDKAARLDLAVGGHKIRLTNLDKVYWPADKREKAAQVTKRDFIRYLAAVSPYMLPHLKDRPLTAIRMPEGIHGERFFQKHWDVELPAFVEKVNVFSEHKNERHDYVLANNLATLLWLGQNGTLEFHVWHSRAKVQSDAKSRSADYDSSLAALEKSVLNYPDYLVFDIDPYIYSGREPKGAEPELNKKGFEGGRKVAFWLRALLKQMSLDAIVKTSGKTGLHVFVPIDRTVTFTEVRRICETVGRHLMQQHPKEITLEWGTEKRTGKIFIGGLQLLPAQRH